MLNASNLQVNKILDIFQDHGHKEIDTSRYYCGGTSQEYLAQAKWQERGLVMDTKLWVQQLSYSSSY